MEAKQPAEQPPRNRDDHVDWDVTWEERSFGEELNDDVIEGTGATAEDVADESDPDEESRLDEGLEETFPASDPVSAKHIT